MKNIFRILMAVLVLSATSCTTEDVTSTVVGNGELIEVSFSASVADLGTRAYGEGAQIDKLFYKIYDANGAATAEPLFDSVCTDKSGNTFTFRLALVKGMTYEVVLWAQDADCNAFTLNNDRTLSITYPATANDESMDAFFGYDGQFTVDKNPSFTLRRPFAQLNASTDDFDDYKNIITLSESSVVVEEVYTKFDLKTGEPCGEKSTTVKFELNTIPTDAYPANYTHLSMIYLLADPGSQLVNATYTFEGTKKNGGEYSYTTPKYTSIPVKQNYRTNILGSLLTKSTEFTVDIDARWGGADEVVNVYSGVKNEQIKITANGHYIFDNLTVNVESGAAVQIAEGLDHVVITLAGKVHVKSNNGSGIGVGNGTNLTLNGGNLTAEGNGDHAFGIGGNGATVTLDGVTVDYVCGGHIQPLWINDTKYGKSEPEGGPAIGGAVVNILNSTITKADGGSKAAAIGAQYWQSAVINIENSTIVEANGGNSSAGIGGSRYNGESKYNLKINIVNSEVTAYGGQAGAGIGSGYDTHCNGQNYIATNEINIDSTSVVNATGGKYAAGIGTGYHSAYLSGAIEEGATINATSGEKVYKDSYTSAQDIGYGVVDPNREFSGDNADVTFTVAGTVIANPLQAKIGDARYLTLAAAYAAAQDGDELVLLGDITLTEQFIIEKNITLNLNGYKVTTTYDAGAAKHLYAFDNKAELVIKNGTIESRGIYNYGTLTLEEGAVIDACDGNGGYGIYNFGTFVMDGGEVKTSNEDDNLVDKGGYDATTIRNECDGFVTINGGVINNISDYTFAIDNQSGGTVTVNGGTITSIHSTISNYGDLTINGGKFTCNGLEGITAHVLVAWKDSTTTINGGTFDGKDNYNGFNVDAVAGATVTIKGGEFKSVHSGSLYGEGTITVSGGVFFDEIAEARLDEGCTLEQMADGNWKVEGKGWYQDTNGNYHIEGAKGWLWMADQTDTFFGSKTIYLENDIDFSGVDMRVTRMWTNEYSATFDGQNHTVSNIWMASNYTSDNQALFDGLMSVKNLTVTNTHVYGMSRVGIIGANINGTIENCHVKNSRSYGYVWQVGGIVGLHSWGEIKNCSIENTSIECFYYGAVGAIAGAMNEVSRKITGCTVKGCSLIKEGTGYPDYDPLFGIAVGYIEAPGTYVFDYNVENTTIKGVASTQAYGNLPGGSTATVTINGVQQ